MGDTEAICRTCIYWKQDFGVWCVNGWSGAERDDGHCRYEPKTIRKMGEECCHHWRDRTAKES